MLHLKTPSRLQSAATALVAILAGLAVGLLLLSSTAEAAKGPVLPDVVDAGRSDSPEMAPDAASAPAPEGAVTSARSGGGLQIARDPEIDDAYCISKCVSTRRATPGATVRLTGRHLDGVRRVVFPGKKKNVKVRITARTSSAVRALVPKAADDGRPFVVSVGGKRSNRSPRDLRILPRRAIPKEVFPVRGPFSYGSSGSRFGAGRPGHKHQGQDLSASCGTKLVAIKNARVAYSTYHSAAGFYVVLANKGDNSSFVYMHLNRKSKLKVGDQVSAGQTVGWVGNTGDSSGCHLHFEYWVGPWQTGGKPIDPLPYLKSL
ncbi:MAG: M23 family metallopeptidase [Solirubrobacterales bacterium]